MVRASYINLNGMWDYCFTPSPNIPARFEGQLPVPFSPEAPLSGVGRKLSPDEFLWYRRSFTLRKQQKDQRVLLHFGAVDQECAVFVNGKPAGEHTGGYLPFTLDITDITVEASNEILVRVRDYSDTSCYSRGKQKLDKGGMFYTAQSGIWQTVWLELVPDPYISAVHFTPDYDGSCCRVRITAGGRRKGGPIRCTVRPETEEDKQYRDDPARPAAGKQSSGAVCVRTFSPDREAVLPCLVSMPGPRRIPSFTMQPWKWRTTGWNVILPCCKCDIQTGSDGLRRIFLNNSPYMQTGVLDQGYWPTACTPPPATKHLFMTSGP